MSEPIYEVQLNGDEELKDFYDLMNEQRNARGLDSIPYQGPNSTGIIVDYKKDKNVITLTLAEYAEKLKSWSM